MPIVRTFLPHATDSGRSELRDTLSLSLSCSQPAPILEGVWLLLISSFS